MVICSSDITVIRRGKIMGGNIQISVDTRGASPAALMHLLDPAIHVCLYRRTTKLVAILFNVIINDTSIQAQIPGRVVC